MIMENYFKNLVGQKVSKRLLCARHLLGPEHRESAVPSVLPERVEEGQCRPLQERRTPVLPLLLKVQQLQHHRQTTPRSQRKLLHIERDKTRQSHTAQTHSASHTKSMSNCILYVTFALSLPSLASRLRKSSMSPGCVSTATVRNSSMVTLIRMSSVLLCSRVKNASLMAAASLPRQA